jgi:hypothetical protein
MDNPTERLTQLAKLHTDGALTDEEFKTLKAKIIFDLNSSIAAHATPASTEQLAVIEQRIANEPTHQLPDRADGELGGVAYKLMPHKQIKAFTAGGEILCRNWNEFKHRVRSGELREQAASVNQMRNSNTTKREATSDNQYLSIITTMLVILVSVFVIVPLSFWFFFGFFAGWINPSLVFH